MSEETKAHLIGEDVKKLPLKDLLKRIGPGLIATGIVIGPGAVTTAAMLGANYGYALIWLMWPIIFMGITFVMTTNWLAITTGMPTIHAIRKYYGKGGAIVVGNYKQGTDYMLDLVVRTVNARGDYDCDVYLYRNLDDGSQEFVAEALGINARGGKIGTKLNLMKDGAKHTGKALGKFLLQAAKKTGRNR